MSGQFMRASLIRTEVIASGMHIIVVSVPQPPNPVGDHTKSKNDTGSTRDEGMKIS